MNKLLVLVLMAALPLACDDDDGDAPADGGVVMMDATVPAPPDASAPAQDAAADATGDASGTTCAQLAACCARIADANLKTSCDQAVAGSDDSLCALASPLFQPACP